ncbi:MAG TPA: transposase [Candidatus Saccharimonadales bacterium]|nr:transposase [Candidatus Saccharimonadales bacterium]
MPSKHIEKIYVSGGYYHLFNRGVNKRVIFKDDEDYAVFLNLFKRHLSNKPVADKKGREYPWYHGGIKLLAFCLMPNHYHLLVYLYDEKAMTKLLQSVCTAYTMYFNKKYKRVGHLFQDRFKASMIQADPYLQHISRYIHLNPEDYRRWQFSSLPYYLGDIQATWIDPKPILDLFKSKKEYENFLRDYSAHRAMLKDIQSELANI